MTTYAASDTIEPRIAGGVASMTLLVDMYERTHLNECYDSLKECHDSLI